MIKKTATVNSPFDNSERVEAMYFNYTRTELQDMLVRNPELIRAAEKINDKEATAIESWNFLTTMVQYGYGERTNDDRFIKNSVIRESFVVSEAYDKLMQEFLEDATSAIEFIASIMPQDVLAAARRQADSVVETPGQRTDEAPAFETVTQQAFRPKPQDHLPSRKELREGQTSMDPEVGG